MSIDTLEFAKSLQAAGVSAQQAEAHAVALNRAVHGGIAAKADIAEVRTDLVKLEERLYSRVLLYLAGQAFAILTIGATIIAAMK